MGRVPSEERAREACREDLKDTWRTSSPKPDEVILHWNDQARLHMKLAKNGMLLEGGQPIFVLVTEGE